MGEMSFSWGDLYPAFTNYETGNMATPDAEDQDALNENADLAKKADVRTANPKFIWLAVGLVALLVIFFGM